MKKSLKMTFVASTAALALVGSFIGCSQPVAPTVDKNKVTDKDIYEQQIGTPTVKGKSLFGKNVIEFSDVNLADDYVLYRFGPTGEFKTADKNVKGKCISNRNATFDGFIANDIVASDNPMVAGSYTYKLIAKSKVNSARVAADLSSGNKEANQDYWANPSVDVSFLPAVASVTVNVSKENMPAWGTKMPKPKTLVENVDYYRGEGTNKNTFYFNPTIDSHCKIYAVIDGVNEYFDNALPSLTSVTLKTTPSTDGTLTLPAFATNYRIFAYNEWSDKVYYPNSDEVEIAKDIAYQSDLQAIDLTIEKKNYTDAVTNVVTPNCFKYTVNSKVKDNYKIFAQRAVIDNDTKVEDFINKVYLHEFENVELKKVAEIEDTKATPKQTTVYLKDDKAQPNVKYYYIFGGTYSTTGKINTVGITDVVYTPTEQELEVAELDATLTTPLPTDKDLIRKDITGEIKFSLADNDYKFKSMARTVKDNDKTVVTDLSAPTVQSNLGKTYVHFKDTLPWDSTLNYALAPTYEIVFTKGDNTYNTYKVTLAVDGINIKDSNKTSTTTNIKKLQEGSAEAVNADEKDIKRKLYSIALNIKANTPKTDRVEFTYDFDATQDNYGKATDAVLQTVGTASNAKYYINCLIKDSYTHQKWGVQTFPIENGKDKKITVTGLTKETNYDFVFTVVEKLNGKDVAVVCTYTANNQENIATTIK